MNAGPRSAPHRPVPTMPLLHLSDLWGPAGALPYPFGEVGVSRWYNARAAIWQGLRCLGLRPGDRLIAPAYTCGSELDALVQAGLKIDFYRIGPDLAADMDDLDQLCRSPAAALFVTHYYGLPQPIAQIAALARRHGLRLIEDVTHGLGSATADGRPLGSFGEMAVFSLWKSLALPDGGLLRLQPDAVRVALPEQGETPGLSSVAGRLRHMVEESVATRHPLAVRALRRHLTDPLIKGLKRRLDPAPSAIPGALQSDRSLPPEAAQLAFQPERRAWRMTSLSSMLLPRLCQEGQALQRRGNFQQIAERLLPSTAVRPLLTDALPPHTSPLFFPLLVAEPRAFCRHLAAQRVGFFRGWCVFHPAVDWRLFPLESHLKEHVVVVPVHPGLRLVDIERIAAVVNDWSVRHGGLPAA